MSDTATNDLAATTPGSEINDTPQAPAPALPADGFFLDGDAPRLGTAPAPAPTPEQRANDAVVVPTTGAGGPTMPMMSPVLQSEEASQRPDQPELPTLPVAPAKASGGEEPADTEEPSEPSHPMAHLMPQKSAPSEASRRAAEIRAAKKAKARKVTMIVSGVIIVITAAVGPPLFKWLSNAINEAGNTSSEQPAD